MIRRFARPMLASVFVIDGVQTLRDPRSRVADAAPLVDRAAPLIEKGEQAVNERVQPTVPPVPKDTETLVKILAGVKVGAGVTFAIGKAPRLSAAALAATHVPSTLSRNAFWSEKDGAAKARKKTGLVTDVALLGALLLATADTEGNPSLAWRARKVSDRVSEKLPGAKAEGAAAGAALAGAAGTVADHARDLAETVREKAPEYAETVREKAPEYAEQVREQAEHLAEQVREKAPEVAATARERADVAREQAAPYAAAARERAEAAREEAAPRLAAARAKADKASGEAAAKAKASRPVARDRAIVAREAAALRASEVDLGRARDLANDARDRARGSIDQVRADVAKAIRP